MGNLHASLLTYRRSQPQQCVSGRLSHPYRTVDLCHVDISCRLKEGGLRAGEVRGPAALLIWCQRVTQAYFPLVYITNMSRCYIFLSFLRLSSFVKLLEERACLLRNYPPLQTQPPRLRVPEVSREKKSYCFKPHHLDRRMFWKTTGWLSSLQRMNLVYQVC